MDRAPEVDVGLERLRVVKGRSAVVADDLTLERMQAEVKLWCEALVIGCRDGNAVVDRVGAPGEKGGDRIIFLQRCRRAQACAGLALEFGAERRIGEQILAVIQHLRRIHEREPIDPAAESAKMLEAVREELRRIKAVELVGEIVQNAACQQRQPRDIEHGDVVMRSAGPDLIKDRVVRKEPDLRLDPGELLKVADQTLKQMDGRVVEQHDQQLVAAGTMQLRPGVREKAGAEQIALQRVVVQNGLLRIPKRRNELPQQEPRGHIARLDRRS